MMPGAQGAAGNLKMIQVFKWLAKENKPFKYAQVKLPARGKWAGEWVICGTSIRPRRLARTWI